MRMTTLSRKMSPYATWYDFKKDLEKQIGHGLPNWDWLAIKPKAPLPWDRHHMQAALSLAAGLQRQRCCSKEFDKS